MLDNKYRLLEVIGLGGSSRVFKAINAEGHEYAIKTIRPEKKYADSMAAYLVNREYENLKVLEGHPNLIKSYDMNFSGVCQLEDGSQN